MFKTAVIVTALAGLVARDGDDSPVGRLPVGDAVSLATSSVDEASGGSPIGDASGTTVGQAGELLGDVRDDKRIGRRSDPGAATVLIGLVAQGRRVAPWT